MRYMGSKARHAKHIIPFLIAGHDQSKPYIEPFVGGGNMIDKVPAQIRWGSDVAEYAVALLDALSKGWMPPRHVTATEYRQAKKAPNKYPPEYVGFVAHCCTYGGKLWGGYARNKSTEGEDSTIPLQQHNALLRQAKMIDGVMFSVGSYDSIEYPDGATVYMDPPYAATTGYKVDFDHASFWDFCNKLAKRCRVFVSEYAAPDNWVPIWERQTPSSLTKNTGAKKATEKLFVMKGGLA